MDKQITTTNIKTFALLDKIKESILSQIDKENENLRQKKIAEIDNEILQQELKMTSTLWTDDRAIRYKILQLKSRKDILLHRGTPYLQNGIKYNIPPSMIDKKTAMMIEQVLLPIKMLQGALQVKIKLECKMLLMLANEYLKYTSKVNDELLDYAIDVLFSKYSLYAIRNGMLKYLSKNTEKGSFSEYEQYMKPFQDEADILLNIS